MIVTVFENNPPPSYIYFSCLFIFATPRGLWDLSSLTRDWTQALGSDSNGVLAMKPPGNSQ